MSRVLVILGMFLLTSCGQSHEEKKDIAAVTCSIMSETRNMDAAVRVREMNNAREKIGGEPFLRGDDAIIKSFEWGLCHELVLNDNYDETLQFLKDTKRERERIAEEKRVEERRIADSKPIVKEEFYDNGNLESRINYQPKIDGGKQHGITERYHENGKLSMKTNYKDGKKDGLESMYGEDGELQNQGNYKEGKNDGLFTLYDTGGGILFEWCYKSDTETLMSYCEK